MIFTGRQQNSLALILFSPREPLFHRRVRGFLTGTTTPSLRRSSFVRFLPVNLLFHRRVRGSRGVFSRRMSGKRRSIILTKRQHSRCAGSLLECFLLVLLFRFQGTFPLRGNDSAALHFSLLLIAFAKLARAKKKRVIAYKEFSSIRNSRGWGTVDCPECVETT